jgi:hypothetical protein
MRSDNRGRKVSYSLSTVLVFAVMELMVRQVWGASKPTPEEALGLLRSCPNSLSDRRHQRWMEGLEQLRAVHLDQVFAVVNGTGPLSCRGLAIISACEIAAREQTAVHRVVVTLTPYLSHPDLWTATIQGMGLIGTRANDELIPLLDTQDDRTWKGVVVILQNINHSDLPADSDLRSARFPDTLERRSRVSAAWRQWWQSAKR